VIEMWVNVKSFISQIVKLTNLYFQNIILNMDDHGFKVVAFNRTVDKVDTFLENEAKGTNVIGSKSLQVRGIGVVLF